MTNPAIVKQIVDCFKNGGKVLICGNGGKYGDVLSHGC